LFYQDSSHPSNHENTIAFINDSEEVQGLLQIVKIESFDLEKTMILSSKSDHHHVLLMPTKCKHSLS